MEIIMIRHAQTPGNALKRYIGRTDEPLSAEGMAQAEALGRYLREKDWFREYQNALWVVSPMHRCIQTAALLQEPLHADSSQAECGCADGSQADCGHTDSGQADCGHTDSGQADCAHMDGSETDWGQTYGSQTEQVAGNGVSILEVCPDISSAYNLTVWQDFRECDFGSFEGKNYQELSGNAQYQEWIDSGGTLPFPDGEAPSAFRKRSCSAFEDLLAHLKQSKEKQCSSDLAGSCRSGYSAIGKQPGSFLVSSDNLDVLPESSGSEASGLILMVVHGGTIMSIMEKWGVDEDGAGHDYYGWHVGNAGGFRLRAVLNKDGTPARLEVIERIEQPK